MDKIQLRAQSKSMKPELNIGKNGLKDSVIEEIKKRLRKNRMIKLKMLKSFAAEADMAEVAEELVKKTDSVLIHQLGHTIVLAEKSYVR